MTEVQRGKGMKDAEREKELGVLYECFAQTTGDFSGTVM